MSLEQTWFDNDDVRQALLTAGFEPVSNHDLADLLANGAPAKKHVYVASAGTE
ncbi:MAG: hypothetical protein M3O70_10995 [Actinomycetota bacterium]|nr:hypothetical protein [Actinomycetota bacterium]